MIVITSRLSRSARVRRPVRPWAIMMIGVFGLVIGIVIIQILAHQ